MNNAQAIKWLLIVFWVIPFSGLTQNSQVNQAEYFWDADPGSGNGIPLVSADGSFNESIETILANTSSLPSPGNHVFSIRLRDYYNNWGPVFSTLIYIDEASTEVRDIQVTTAEYFWDTDTGEGTGTPILAFDNNFNEAIEQAFHSTTQLPSEGNHLFGLRYKDAENVWSPVFSSIIFIDEPFTEQREIKITSGEIFWDADPGQGNGIAVIALDGNYNEAIEQVIYSSSSLPSVGNHIFNLRLKDAENNWSPVFSTIIYVDDSFTEQRDIKITAGEVFWDSDPGVGNGMPVIAFDGNFNEALEQVVFTTGTLPSIGNHLFGMRLKDAENTWSPLFSTIIYVDEVFTEQREIKITAGEIFWDTDPGAGNGIPMLVFDGLFNEAIEQAMYNTSALPSVGNHTFNLRYRDAENAWSPVFSTLIHVDEPTTAQRQIKITLGEMFWDNDPGQGNGIGLAAFDGNLEEAIEQVITCTAALPSPGAHKLSLRVRDAENQWSSAFGIVILIDEPVTDLREIKITSAEYFWDVDPGQGNATPLVAFDGAYNEALEAVATSTSISLPEGPHVLRMRLQEPGGNWGPLFGVVVLVDETTTEQRNIFVASGEYWFDADPGQGNATPMLSMDGSFNEVLEGIKGGAIPSPVTSGVHALYMRAKDPQGGWGPAFGIVVNMDIAVSTFTTAINGLQNICSGVEQLNQPYYAIAAAGSTYTWSVTGGIIIGGQGTPDILVNWNSGGNHTVILNQCLGGPCQADTLVINIHNVTETTDYVTICAGESYFAGGALRTTPGSYVDELQSIYGCDSIVTTVLTVLDHVIYNTTTYICQGQSILLGGAMQSSSGTYLDTYTAANGCDSLVYTTLTVHPNYNQNVLVEICTGDSYFVGGAYQTTSGFYSDMYSSAYGCDSLVVTQLVVGNSIHTTEYVEICQGESYFAGGANQTTSGNYIDIIPGVCTEIRTTVLTVHPTYDIVHDITIYTGESYFAEGEWQTEGGTYIDYYLTTFGCDSIVTTNLNVTIVPNTVQTIHICEGESFYAGGAEQTTTGTYVDVVTGACTATLTTYLFVHSSYYFEQNVQICTGESYYAGGAEQTTSGTYIDVFQTTAGCDSIYTTILTVVNSINTNQTVHICDGESYFAGGDFQTTSGIYVDEISNGVCVETMTTVLVVHAIETTYSPVSICQGQSYFAGGEEQTIAGIYQDTLQTSFGCDSILVTLLSVTPPAETHQVMSICDGDSILLGGIYQTDPGEYMDVLEGVSGCDSIVYTTLSLYPTFVTDVDASICFGDSIFLGGNWQTEAGEYQDLLNTIHGCDSLLITTLAVVIDVPTPFVVNNGDGTVSCSTVADSYSWIIDGLGCEIITIETIDPIIYLPEYCDGEAFVINVAVIDGGCQSAYSEPETIIIALCSQVNDHCSGAYELEPDGPILIDSNQCATNAGETEGTCSPDIGRSAWYKFDALPNTSYTIKLENIIPISSQFNPKLEVFQGSCSSMVQLDCVNVNGNSQGETVTIEDLDPLQDQYIRVSGFLVQAGSYRISIVKNNNCAGDLDGNGVINVSDLLLFAANFGCTSGCVADMDGNGLVNVIDLLIFNAIFGTACQ